jgi:transposase
LSARAHIGGDKLFVDYVGDTVPVIVDRLTGQVRPVQIFVAVIRARRHQHDPGNRVRTRLAGWRRPDADTPLEGDDSNPRSPGLGSGSLVRYLP